jgi:hypothetical protein
MSGVKIVVAASLLAVAGVAQAQGTGVHQHEGFFLQLDLGGGYMQSEFDEGGTDIKFDGGAGEFSVAVGYNVRPGLILGGQYWGSTAMDPDLERNGTSLNLNDVTLTLSGIGLNVTYYFMPLNLYIQATPSITMLTAEFGNIEAETDTGFGVRFAVGKEWWVSDNWALGLNAQFAFSMNDEDVSGGGSGTWDSRWYGLAFSATYD